MRMARGGLFVTGKSVGSVDIVMASVEDDGDCWARQDEMLFTVIELVRASTIRFEEHTEYDAVT